MARAELWLWLLPSKSSIPLHHTSALQPCGWPPRGETHDGAEEGDRIIGTWLVSVVLTWQRSGELWLWLQPCQLPVSRHKSLPCAPQKLLSLTGAFATLRITIFEILLGFCFGFFFSLGVETELGSVNEAVLCFFPYDSSTASGCDRIKSSKLSNVRAGQCLSGWPAARIQMVVRIKSSLWNSTELVSSFGMVGLTVTYSLQTRYSPGALIAPSPS